MTRDNLPATISVEAACDLLGLSPQFGVPRCRPRRAADAALREACHALSRGTVTATVLIDSAEHVPLGRSPLGTRGSPAH